MTTCYNGIVALNYMDLNEVKKPEKEKLYSTQEVATFMGISYITLYRLVKCGKIKALNIAPKGSKKEIWRFRAEDVQSYYDNLPHPIDRLESVNK